MAVWHVGKPVDQGVLPTRGSFVYLVYPEIDAPEVVYYKGRPAPLIGNQNLQADSGRYAGIAETVHHLEGTGLIAISTRLCGSLNHDSTPTTHLYVNGRAHVAHGNEEPNALVAVRDGVATPRAAGTMDTGCGQATEHGMVVWPYGRPTL